MATLSSSPRSLMELWREFEFGIDGRKPASQFTIAERNNRSGGIKQKYYRRKDVWDAISCLIRGGHTIQSAIVRIREIYGQSASITQIIENIRRDRQTYKNNGGYHPNLVNYV